MIRTVRINGRELRVRLEPDGCFEAGERSGQVSIVEIGPGLFSVLLDGRSFEVRMNGSQAFVNGEPMSVEVDDPRAARRRREGGRVDGRQTVAAPMPGKVVRVLVNQGDEVEAGQGIAVVEAMKMQNEMKAARAGRVVSIAAREGAAVAAGEVLAVIE